MLNGKVVANLFGEYRASKKNQLFIMFMFYLLICLDLINLD